MLAELRVVELADCVDNFGVRQGVEHEQLVLAAEMLRPRCHLHVESTLRAGEARNSAEREAARKRESMRERCRAWVPLAVTRDPAAALLWADELDAPPDEPLAGEQGTTQIAYVH